MNITVLGAGSWGTTLALLLAKKNNQVKVWEFRPDAASKMEAERENKEFLKGYKFPDNLHVYNDIHWAVDGSKFCLFVVPSHATRPTAKLLENGLPSDCLIASASKGIEQKSLLRMSEVFNDVWGSKFNINNYVCLSGPSHAEEVVRGLPTSIVAASTNIDSAHQVQNLMSNERFRMYSTDDLIGVELGGSLKNVIAIAAGISAGLGFGDNTLGALLTRGLVEMSRLGVHLGGQVGTFSGLSGMGDLITTCCSQHSRNRYVGEQIGKGRKLQEILDEMLMVAEGVNTTASAWALAQHENIEMPIAHQVHSILFEDADPMQATIDLMTRKLKVEIG
jgi:glycerol-3-phosphate dehydrogenase (NAD(P)+)